MNISRLLPLQSDVFEPLTGTGTNDFACQESGLSQIFKLIVSASKKDTQKCERDSVKLSYIKKHLTLVNRPRLKNVSCLSSLEKRVNRSSNISKISKISKIYSNIKSS